MSRFIAVDVGAESGRLIVGTLANDTLTLEEAHRFPNGGVSVQGNLHWDILRIFNEIKIGLSKIAKEAGGDDLVSIGVDTWGVDFGLLDASNNLIGNPHCYRDPRTDGKMEEVLEKVSQSNIFNATAGIQFMSINTLYQLFSIKDSWMLREARTFLMMPDLLNFWLTGVKACEYTNATTTQFFDSRIKGWARGLLDQLGIPHHFLPDIILPGNVLAPLDSLIADEVGLSPLPVIAVASHDTASAIAGVPAESDNFAWMSSGTWSLMGGVANEAITRPEALEYNFSNYGGPGGGVLPWKNIMGLWLVQECRRSWAKQGQEHSYAELTQLALDAKPFTAIIDPDNVAFLAPPDMLTAIQDFCRSTGQGVPGSAGEIIRTVLESLALRYRWVMEKLEELVGHPYEQLHVVGGGSQNLLLNQLTADALNKPVIAGPIEATAMGNILVQAVATGHLASLEKAREVIRNSTQVQTFNPNPSPAWDHAYTRFLSLLT